jgi:hypothetical protein
MMRDGRYSLLRNLPLPAMPDVFALCGARVLVADAQAQTQEPELKPVSD